jgi:tetratricopeptide (TPR) repeat protein
MHAVERTGDGCFAAGLACHDRDDYPGAEQAFQAAVTACPRHADAWRLLGEARLFQGKFAASIEAYQRTLELDPNRPDTHSNIAVAFQKLGRLQEAESHYRRAVELRPEGHDARHNLVALLLELKRVDAAATEADRLLQLRPDSADSHLVMGLVRLDQGRKEDAANCFERAIALKPNHARAWMNLGQTRMMLNRQAEAIPCFERVLELQPNEAEACTQLGLALYSLDRCEEAIRRHEQSLRFRPDHPPALNNLGLAWIRLGNLDRAIESLSRSVEVRPDYHQGLMNLNAALGRAHRFEEALDVLRRALRNWPDGKGNRVDRLEEPAPRYEDATDEQVGIATVQTSLADQELRLGDFERSWKRQRWRWCKRKIPRFTKRMWDGGEISGRTLLVHAEQGLGDAIQHLRFLTMLKERGARVWLQCSERLHPLLRRCSSVDALFPPGTPPPGFDYHVPLLSLVDLLGVTLESLPAQPYLFADPGLMDRWKQALDRHTGIKIGLCWQGNRDYAHDRERSAPLAAFAPIARIPGVRLVSLQMGPGQEQLTPLRGQWPFLDLGRLDESSGPFMDTAALMTQLDLFITVDTSAGHLAGALGAPVWLALAEASDSRWMLDRADSPWYPSARLFRQRRQNEWGSVFREMAEAIRRNFHRGNAVAVGLSPGEALDRLAEPETPDNPAAMNEFNRLREQAESLTVDAEIADFAKELRESKLSARQAEDELRRCEQNADFGEVFVAAARAWLRARERREAILNEIERRTEHGDR